MAGVTLTFIHILGAVQPCVAIWALAGELMSTKIAGAVGTRCCDAGIVQLIAVFTHEPHGSFGAQAHIITHVFKTGGTVVAGG